MQPLKFAVIHWRSHPGERAPLDACRDAMAFGYGCLGIRQE